MATVSVIKLKIRRGTDAQRKMVTFDNGEIAYVTDPDARRLYIGDGVTVGGISTSMKFFYGSINSAAAGSSTPFSKAQIGDLIFNIDNTQLYILSGADVDGFPDFTNTVAYQHINVNTDQKTISYDAYGNLRVNTQGISAAQLSTDALDTTQGFFRPGPTAPFRLSYDNYSIKINTSNQIYVDPFATDWTAYGLYTTRPAGAGILWVDTSADNTLKIS
jgi:hypothetical protein